MNKKLKLVELIFLILPWLSSCNGRITYSPNRKIDSILNLPEIKFLTDSIKKFPNDPEIYLSRSEILFQLKQPLLAKINIMDAIKLEPNSYFPYYAMGEILLYQDSPILAAQYLKKAIILSGGNYHEKLEYSRALFLGKKYQASICYLKKMEKLFPGVAEIYGMESQNLEAIKDTTFAIDKMKMALQLEPDNYDVLMAMGDLYRKINNRNCLIWYRKANFLNLTKGEPLYSMALYYEINENNSQAEKFLNQCINVDDHYTKAYILLGKIILKKKHPRKALAILDLAVKVSPTNPKIYLMRGICQEQIGDSIEAKHDFQRSLDLDKSLKEAKIYLKGLNK